MDHKQQHETKTDKPVSSPASTADVEVMILPLKTDTPQVPAVPTEDIPSFLESLAKTVGGVTESITHTAAQTGKAFVETATEVGEATAKQTYQLITHVTQGTGEAVDRLGSNWLVRRVTGVLNFGWLLGATDNVDLGKATEAVRKLQREHPNEFPSQISHRIMVEKATYAGGIGLASSIIPGEAAALFAVDLAATTRLQAEMVYQVAAAYGLDLQDPGRKGEVVAIFGLGLGGGRVLKAAGLGLLRNIPFAGAVIGASSNAAMIYSLGYAACRFYEAKLDSSISLTSEATVTALQEQSETYLETAIAQQVVMDQILAHMILASHPNKSWEDILPDLKALKLSQNSLEAIASNLKSPQPLETLLNQLTLDFAFPLLAQCNRIAKLDGVRTPEEERVLRAIANKFNIDLSLVETAVKSER